MTTIRHTKIITKHLLLLMLMLFCQSLSAQKLTVESMRLLPDDPAARVFENQREDDNGTVAGIVKVIIALDGVEFEGGSLLYQEKRGMGEYWVWMADRATKLTVRARNYQPLEINFRNYDFQMLHSKNTYKLVITVPTAGVQQDDGKGILAFQIEPKLAELTIDGVKQTLFDGQFSQLVDKGTYHYEITATGYTPQSGTLRVDENTQKMMVSLQPLSVKSTLQVSCATAGAQIYVDNELRGASPQTLTLSKGAHRVEARLQGYRTNRQDITLGENEERRIDIPALERLSGKIAVTYLPFESDVYVDGHKVGVTPGTFSQIPVGSHKVEIRKDGYVTASVNATVNENQTAELSGTLTQSAVSVQNNNNNAVVSQPSSSGGDVQTFSAKGVKFKMVRVQGGTFDMGATPEQGDDAGGSEKPAHSVTLDDYMIGETEVTQALWKAVMGTTVSQQRDKVDKSYSLSGEGNDYPMYYVSWNKCKEFIEKLNTETGLHFRLPTEAEWEYAARGGNKSGKTKYSGSDTIDDVAWYWKNSGDEFLTGTDSDYNVYKVMTNNSKTHPVGTKKANELGIHDMSGNVWEWCEDRFDNDYYRNSPQMNPKGPDKGLSRVIRGGSWLRKTRSSRVSSRWYSEPSNCSRSLGFRLAL